MRRIVSALGLARDKDRRNARNKSAATPTRSPLRSESTPALVHYSPDSASSSGIRTPSDIEAPDMLAVPIVHPSASTESVAHSVRSSRWLPASLFRSLSRKRPEPVTEVPPPDADDASSDSHSTHSSRPRSPPALLPPPAPPFATSTGRRSLSPASSIYRAGLANVQRQSPPSRANLALQAFTQPLVMAAAAPTPHPLRAPDTTSPLRFPRSVSCAHIPPSHSLRIQLQRARVLRRLEEGNLTSAEEVSILPFATRTPRPPMTQRRKPALVEAEDAVADLDPGARTGRWSRGLRRWVARSVFEDRVGVFSPAGIDIVRPARGLGTETLDFSDGTLALAGLAIDAETEESDDDFAAPHRRTSSPAPIAPRFSSGPMDHLGSSASSGPIGTAPERASTAPSLPTKSKTKAPVVRGVRFADDDDATDGDDLPLAVLASVQKKRAEKEARARHARYVSEQAEDAERTDKRRSYAEEVARARARRDSARAGVERPASMREAESRRMTLAGTGLSTVREGVGSTHVREGHVPGHARTGSGGGSSSSHRRRNTVGEGADQVTSPTKSVFSSSSGFSFGSPSASTFTLPSATTFTPTSSGFLSPTSSSGFLTPNSMPGLPSSAPSSMAAFPTNMSMPSPQFMHPHSNSFPRTNSPSNSPGFPTINLPPGSPGLPSPTLPFARSMTGSPLRSSFALGANSDEFGAMLAAASSGSSRGVPTMQGMQGMQAPMQGMQAPSMQGMQAPSMQAIMAQNQALMAQNQMLGAMLSMGLPNPPFAHSGGGSSASGSRASGGSGGRPGPTPVQRSGLREGYGPGLQAPTKGLQTPTKAPKTGTQTPTKAPAKTGPQTPTRSSTTPSKPISHSHSKSASQSPAKSAPKAQPDVRGHARSKSGHSVASHRTSRLGMGMGGVPVPPVPSVPTGVYSLRGRVRPDTEVIT